MQMQHPQLTPARCHESRRQRKTCGREQTIGEVVEVSDVSLKMQIAQGSSSDAVCAKLTPTYARHSHQHN